MAPALDHLAGVVSSTFIRVPADQVGPVIDDMLTQIVSVLDIECASLSVCAPGGTTFDVVHVSARAGLSQSNIDDLHAVPWCAQQLLQGQPLVLASVPADLPPDARGFLHTPDGVAVRSHVAVPVAVGGHMTCALAGSSSKPSPALSAEIVQPLRLIAESMASAMLRAEQEPSLHQLRSEVDRLTGRIGQIYLREKIEPLCRDFPRIIGESPALRRPSPGDGSRAHRRDRAPHRRYRRGKELLASTARSDARRQRTLVSVNCAALPSR